MRGGLEARYLRAAERFLARVALVELSPVVLRRALEPFPLPIRVLDALYLASIDFLIQRRLDVRLATSIAAWPLRPPRWAYPSTIWPERRMAVAETAMPIAGRAATRPRTCASR